MFENFLSSDIGDSLITSLKYVYMLMPVWLPLAFIVVMFKAWVYFIRSRYWAGMGNVLLELKIPREIFKSPLAMEVVLNQLHQTADEGNWYWKYWRGQTRSWFSLEIASFGGQIHLYIWARKKYKNGIEAHLYSQYPGIEIYEVEDYTKNFYFDPARHKMAACQWELSEPDPYPIATYVDYGLDKDPKEELKVDPLTSQLEFLGSLPKGHNLWIQIIVRAHKKDRRKPGTFFEKIDGWKDDSKKEIDKILKDLTPEGGTFPRIPTKGEAEKIAALQRSVGKAGFDTTIRSLYFADKEKYDSVFLGGMLGSFKQYSTLGYNGFSNAGWHLAFKGAWYDWWKTDQGKLAMMVMEEYKLRRFFFSPYVGKWFYSKPFILNSEELATIYHLPGAVAGTPTFERVPSRKSEAPSNLPV